MSASEKSPGQRLYERFCGSEVSNSARYYSAMNPAVVEDWERLGREWDALRQVEAAAREVVEHMGSRPARRRSVAVRGAVVDIDSPTGEPRWTFDRKLISEPSSRALLSLTGYVNDAAAIQADGDIPAHWRDDKPW